MTIPDLIRELNNIPANAKTSLEQEKLFKMGDTILVNEGQFWMLTIHAKLAADHIIALDAQIASMNEEVAKTIGVPAKLLGRSRPQSRWFEDCPRDGCYLHGCPQDNCAWFTAQRSPWNIKHD